MKALGRDVPPSTVARLPLLEDELSHGNDIADTGLRGYVRHGTSLFSVALLLPGDRDALDAEDGVAWTQPKLFRRLGES